MQKQVCTPGKLLKNYIIDYLVWGVFIAVGVAILQIVCGSLVETFQLSSILLIIVTAFLNIIGNFLVIFLTIRTLFKKCTILNENVKSFVRKIMVFYVIVLILLIIYNFLGYTSFIVETINMVLNVLILAFQFFYTKYMTMKEASTNGFNYQMNYNINVEQNSQGQNQSIMNQLQDAQAQNQIFNNMSNQVGNNQMLNQTQDSQIQMTNQDNSQLSQSNINIYNKDVSVNNQINENIHNNINQYNQEIINNDNNVVNAPFNNEFMQDVNFANNVNNQKAVENYVNENKHGLSINSIDNNKAINSIQNFENGNVENNSVTTKICPGCGKEISINNNFCNLCGYVYKN